MQSYDLRRTTLVALCLLWCACTLSRSDTRADAAQVTWQINPNRLQVALRQTSSVQITAADASGARLVGISFQLMASAGLHVVHSFSATDAQGHAHSEIACIAPGPQDLTVLAASGNVSGPKWPIGGITCLAKDEEPAIDAAVPQQIVFLALPLVAAADANAPTPLALLVIDGNGTPVANQLKRFEH